MDNTEINQKRRSRYIGTVDIDEIQRQLLGVLKRETQQLLDESFAQKLSEESSKSLVNYLKLLKQLKDDELKALEMLTEEELEARASTNQYKGT